MLVKSYPIRFIQQCSLSSMLLVLGGSLFLALSAQLQIPLWFTPVPITMQTAGIMLLSFLLRPNLALASVSLYLLESALGFPFLAGGKCGILPFIGPTAGYLWSFPLAAYLMALFANKAHHPFQVVATLAGGAFLILVSGTAWLSLSLGLSLALSCGLYPFLPGAAFKVAAVFTALYAIKTFRSV